MFEPRRVGLMSFDVFLRASSFDGLLGSYSTLLGRPMRSARRATSQQRCGESLGSRQAPRISASFRDLGKFDFVGIELACNIVSGKHVSFLAVGDSKSALQDVFLFIVLVDHRNLMKTVH